VILGYRLEVEIGGNSFVIRADKKNNLLTILRLAGAEHLNAPCGGMGTCGKCRIRVTGKVRSVGSGEAFRLEDEEILACRYIPAGKCRIYVPEEQK